MAPIDDLVINWRIRETGTYKRERVDCRIVLFGM